MAVARAVGRAADGAGDAEEVATGDVTLEAQVTSRQGPARADVVVVRGDGLALHVHHALLQPAHVAAARDGVASETVGDAGVGAEDGNVGQPVTLQVDRAEVDEVTERLGVYLVQTATFQMQVLEVHRAIPLVQPLRDPTNGIVGHVQIHQRLQRVGLEQGLK